MTRTSNTTNDIAGSSDSAKTSLLKIVVAGKRPVGGRP